MRRTAGYTWTDYKTNAQIAKDLKITPILDKLLEYKRSRIQHVNRMPRNRLPRVMKHYCPTGRRNHGRPLKRFVGTWDRRGSTGGPAAWKIYDDDDDNNNNNIGWWVQLTWKQNLFFFECQSIVTKEFVPQRQTAKQDYRETFEWLRIRVHRVRPETADKWLLHHDNAPCHNDVSLNEVLTKNCIPAFAQPQCSPDLTPCDLFLFPKLKFHLKGRQFGTVDNIQKVVTDKPRALPLQDLQHCYQEWERHLPRPVASRGNYFEGDNVDL